MESTFGGVLHILGPALTSPVPSSLSVWGVQLKYPCFAVNNVGTNIRSPTVEYSSSDYEHIMNVNLTSGVRPPSSLQHIFMYMFCHNTQELTPVVACFAAFHLTQVGMTL